MATGNLTVRVRTRTRYARFCIWLAGRIGFRHPRLTCFILNCARLWVRVEAGAHPRWQRVRLHAQYMPPPTPKREPTEVPHGE